MPGWKVRGTSVTPCLRLNIGAPFTDTGWEASFLLVTVCFCVIKKLDWLYFVMSAHRLLVTLCRCWHWISTDKSILLQLRSDVIPTSELQLLRRMERVIHLKVAGWGCSIRECWSLPGDRKWIAGDLWRKSEATLLQFCLHRWFTASSYPVLLQ